MQRSRPWWFPALAVSALVLSDTESVVAAGPQWKAGTATVVITPDEPMWMAGYAARDKPAEGTVQDLFAKALALEDREGNRLVIVTADLIGIPRDLRDVVVERVVEAYDLPSRSLLLNASHTHC